MYASSSYLDRPSLRSRGVALALSIGITALIVLMLVRLGVIAPDAAAPKPLATFRLMPEAAVPQHARTLAHTRRASGGAARRVPVPAKPAPAPTPTPAAPELNLLQVSHQDLAMLDTAMLSPHRAAARAGGDSVTGSGAGAGRGSEDGMGEGPGGATLYNAEWYVKPTDAQMDFYMPHNGRTGWGMIACRTAARYHVEDCQELGDTPGSGFARAMREAAWQFLVRPPRVDGKPMIGAWVRIRYDFTLRSEPRGG